MSLVSRASREACWTSELVGSRPVGLRYDITAGSLVTAMLCRTSDFLCFFDAGEFRASIGGCRITSTSAAPIPVIVRSSSRSKPELLRTITEMGAALVDVIRHPPMLARNSPASKNPVKKLLRAYIASFSQVHHRKALSQVARVVGGPPEVATGVAAPPSNLPAHRHHP